MANNRISNIFNIFRSPRPIDLEQRLEIHSSVKWEGQSCFGVLFCGESGLWAYSYEENMSLAYQVLLENGYEEKDIFVLYETGKKSFSCPVDGIASKESMDMVLQYLSGIISDSDKLFLYVTGHGHRDKKHEISTIGTPKDWSEISEYDVEKELFKIKPRTGILLFDQCYGGGFAERLGKGNYVAMSASTAGEDSNSNTFPQAFFSALQDNLRISIGKAFDHAVEHDRFAQKGIQTPQLESKLGPYTVFINNRSTPPDIQEMRRA